MFPFPIWSRSSLLFPGASGSALFMSCARAFAAKSRGSLESGKEKPSYLAAEIERMKKAYEIYSESPPKPFKLRENGDLHLLLNRRKGPEDILVRCDLFFHPRGGSPDGLAIEELEEQPEEQKVVVNITLTITKGGPEALEVNVDCDRKGYAVNHIVYRENKEKKNEDEYIPAFWRISPKLREEFHNFLERRGLDERFACWVHDQMDNKAFKERLQQLERINSFLGYKLKQ